MPEITTTITVQIHVHDDTHCDIDQCLYHYNDDVMNYDGPECALFGSSLDIDLNTDRALSLRCTECRVLAPQENEHG